MSEQLAADIAAAFPDVPREVLTAIGNTDRRLFVHPDYAGLADKAIGIPIPGGSVTTCPFIVARMLGAALDGRQRLGRVLEIGTGSGWQTALLCALADHVDTVEVNATVAAAAKVRLADLADRTVPNVLCGDGLDPPPEWRGYDAIVACASAREARGWSRLRARLALGGVLVAPIGGAFSDQSVYRLTAGGDPVRVIPATRFVALSSGACS